MPRSGLPRSAAPLVSKRLNAFDRFYAQPTPAGAVELAIADATETRMPHEFVEQLHAAYELLLTLLAERGSKKET